MCCESGGLPTEKNVRDIQLLCSVQEGLSQGKESRTCASLMLLGAKVRRCDSQLLSILNTMPNVKST